MILLSNIDFTLPLADPVLKFLLILLIILAAPLLLNKLRVPHLLGLIIAGEVVKDLTNADTWAKVKTGGKA